MATVQSTLKLFDAFSRPLQNITQALNMSISAMESLQSTTNKNTNIAKTFAAAKQKIASAEADIRSAIDQSTQAQQKFNRSVQEGKSKTNQLLLTAKRLIGAYISLQAARSAISASDTFISTQARLGLIVDEGQTTDQLKDNIFAAAERARGDFVTMANSASKLGLLAGDAFSDTNEVVSFTETMQKAFKISGASIMEQQAGMYQLTQAMAAGKLQGDEFRSIMENAPMLADAIAKFTGKSKGELKMMSAEGTITADIIKGALFSAADDINAKFETLPKTFGDVFQQFKNDAFQAFEPVFQRLNGWLNSTQGSAFVQSMTNAIYGTAPVVDFLLRMVIWAIGVVQSGWSVIEPMLTMITFALALWALQQIPLLITKLWLMIQAWMLLNLPILLVGAAIGLLIYALYRWGDVVTEVLGFVGGLFGVLFGFIYNKFALFANITLSIAEFFINVWKDPIYAVKKLFYDLVINSLQWMENLAKGIENIINKIPGLEVNMTDGLSNILKNLEEARGNLKSKEDVVQLMRFEQKDYADAFKFGQKIGQSVGNFAADGVQRIFNAGKAMFDTPKFDGAFGMPELDNINRINEIGKINDTVDVSSEDIKVMRELAELRNIQNFVSLTPTVRVQTGDINNGYDIDTVVARIEQKLEEEFVASAQGVYE